jgi:hypothetical protein
MPTCQWCWLDASGIRISLRRPHESIGGTMSLLAMVPRSKSYPPPELKEKSLTLPPLSRFLAHSVMLAPLSPISSLGQAPSPPEATRRLAVGLLAVQLLLGLLTHFCCQKRHVVGGRRSERPNRALRPQLSPLSRGFRP